MDKEEFNTQKQCNEVQNTKNKVEILKGGQEKNLWTAALSSTASMEARQWNDIPELPRGNNSNYIPGKLLKIRVKESYFSRT